jgi:hypothetical protein
LIYNLKSIFLDNRKAISLSDVKELINVNSCKNGWLIFSTHGIEEYPNDYGCTPEFFNNIVQYSIKSRSTVLPVVQVMNNIKYDIGRGKIDGNE